MVYYGGLDIRNSDIIGVVVGSNCDYFSSVAFPDELEGGLRVAKLCNSSVTYELAIFKKGEALALAAGSFTHVFVTREDPRRSASNTHSRDDTQRLIDVSDRPLPSAVSFGWRFRSTLDRYGYSGIFFRWQA